MRDRFSSKRILTAAIGTAMLCACGDDGGGDSGPNNTAGVSNGGATASVNAGRVYGGAFVTTTAVTDTSVGGATGSAATQNSVGVATGGAMGVFGVSNGGAFTGVALGSTGGLAAALGLGNGGFAVEPTHPVETSLGGGTGIFGAGLMSGVGGF
jgi:hypothetical protein